MPFYAVAIGKEPGVYMTWDECQNQTKGYPKAKYKKFNTQSEAKNFVNSHSCNKSFVKEDTASTTSGPYNVENLNLPKLMDVGKNFSSALLKNDRVNSICEKLDRFIEETNKRLNEFSTRISALEAVTFFGDTPEERKRKSSNATNKVEESVTPKKKKTLVTVQVDETEDNESNTTRTRSKSQSKVPTTTNSSAAVEEVDGPWCKGTSNFQGGYNPSGFIYSPDGYVVVFTDGACSDNGRKGAKAGVGVWFNHNNPFNASAPVLGSATNNNAEIQAATRAIEQANLAGITKLNIHTDSQFLINCITAWINKWKRNDWVTTNGGPVKNKEQLIILDNAIQTLEAVKWTHVRGHMGNVGNEEADALARKGASLY